ncbi:MAG: hypothetical protein K2X07_10720 [Caulobacteraceae bacterium]|nr:hypothetical protein [Caulobacteraceae bacterium]
MTKATEPMPTRDDAEFGYGVAKIVLGAIPVVGGAAQELLEKAVGDPLRRRQETWLAELGQALNALVERVEGISAEALAEDPAFVSAAARATQDALLTHSERKRDALRNTVLNVAVGVKLDDVLVGAFMSYIKRFSDGHLKLLALLREPMADDAYAAEARNTYAGSIYGVVSKSHPDIATQPELLDRLYADLSSEGLLGSFKAIMTGGGLQTSQTTAIGNAFSDFISEPRVEAP